MSKDSRNLDLLRALAVMLVLFDHTMRFFGFEHFGGFAMSWLGGMGVSYFFVHTCLVLMLSLERLSGKSTGGALVCSFYLRRAFRIYPLSVFVITAVLVLGIPSRSISQGIVNHYPATPGEIVSNLLLVQNLTFHHDILGVLWSLPLEVQMYLALPFLFLFARRAPWTALLGLWVLAVPVAFWQPRTDLPGMARLNVLQYIPCFLPGVLAFAMTKRFRPRLPAWLWPPALLVLTAASGAYQKFSGTWVVCLALGCAIPFFAEVPRGWLSWVGHQVAKYSYGIYLGHLFCIWMAFVKIPGLPLGVRFSGVRCPTRSRARGRVPPD